MLQFFKKSGRGATLSCDDKTPLNNKNKRHSMPSSMDFQIDDIILDENLIENEQDKIIESRSRLSMNLNEIVSNKNCLSYFIQFLEMKNALSLIKFYLDTECFKTATEKLFKTFDNNNCITNNCNTNNCLTNNCNKIHVSRTTSECSDKISINSNFDISSDLISIDSQLTDTTISLQSNNDLLTNNYKENCIDKENEVFPKSNQLNCNNTKNSDDNKNVPELKTLCDLSMRKPLTDDEKSLICAETMKHKQSILKYSNSAAAADVNQIEIDNNLIKLQNKTTSINSIIATDAIKIYRKYLNRNSQYYIDIPAEIHSTISLELCTEQQQNDDSNENYYYKLISAYCFNEAQKYVFDRLEFEYLNEFLDSSYYCKFAVDILTNIKLLKLNDILNSESALFYFMEYLEQENQRNLLEFWMAAINYRKHYQYQYNHNIININEAKNDSMILYEKYFSLQAEQPLKISNKIRCCIEENICSFNDNNEHNDNLKDICNCFDLPIRIIEKFIEKEHFQNFLLSQLFTNYLNEMKSKIQHENYNNNNKKIIDNLITPYKRINNHRKTLSDCTFDTNFVRLNNGFISQQNTLLAMESNKSKIKTANKSNTTTTTTDMQIDSRQLTDPDLLWRRTGNNNINKNGRLTFGRVNSLGRYERDFELGSTDEKWTLISGGNKIKNAVRKFVNLPEDKVQEEIAWQVAEMIVKDITSITLGNEMEISE